MRGGMTNDDPKRPTIPALSVSGTDERSPVDQAREEKARRWQDKNTAGFEAWNLYVKRNGVPLGQYRKF
jgi:post-segregation antitoxin (ccd killing protein)